MKKHIVVVIPDGVSAKNYLLSSFIQELLKFSTITIYTTLPQQSLKELLSFHDNTSLNIIEFSLPKESLITRILRESTSFARIKFNIKISQNKSIYKFWKKPSSINARFLLMLLSEFLGTVLSFNYKLMLFFESMASSTWSKSIIEEFENQIIELKPSSIFISNQRIPNLMPLSLAAKKLNIPVFVAVFSWDNLPKARFNVKYDKVLVWSNYMAVQLKLFYPETLKKNVLITGTPQFEHYLNNNLKLERLEFANKYKLDASKTWILFSGDDVLTSPNDPLYLEDLAVFVANNYNNEVEIILRKAPADSTNRFDTVVNTYTEFVTKIEPDWCFNQYWSLSLPNAYDLTLQYNLAYHCKAVVNLGSTMALDFATFDKPSFYVNYNHLKFNKFDTSIIYSYEHFKSMKGLNAVEWVTKPDDYKNLFESLLTNPDTLAKDKQKWFEKIAMHPLTESSKRIAKALE